MQGAFNILADNYPALRAQVALLLQHPWNVGQLCKLVNLSTILDIKLWSIPRWLETVFGYRRVVEYLPEFNVLCRFRLGYEIFPQSIRNCPLCGAVNDVNK